MYGNLLYRIRVSSAIMTHVCQMENICIQIGIEKCTFMNKEQPLSRIGKRT